MERKPDVVFSAAEIARLRSPLVYVFWDRRKVAVYVGLGTKGVARPLNLDHHVLGKRKGERLELYCCATADEASALERELIEQLRPRWNRKYGSLNNPCASSHSIERGIRRIGNGTWQAYAKINGRFVSRVFPPETPFKVMREWRRTVYGMAAKARFNRYLDKVALIPKVSCKQPVSN